MAATICFFCLIAASCTRIAAQEQVLNQFPCTTNFIRYPSRALLSSKISTVQVTNVGECILHCAKEKFCKSINFASKSEAATKTHQCELMKEDKYSEIEKFAVSSEFDHYSPKSPCEGLPCLNGGSCATNYINNTFSCDCQTGYQGKHCQTEIDECSSKPCQNGGTCSNLVGGYRCTCAVGFRGTNCTIGSDLQKSVILQNHTTYLQQLKAWLGPVLNGIGGWGRCWHGNTNGFAASTFHSLCDGKGPTVLIVKVGSYIFGGYTDQSWGGPSAFKRSSKSFLFTLYNTHGYKPQMLALTGSRNQYAIHTRSDYGPTFGSAHDLRIINNANTNTGSHFYSGYTYQAPSGCSVSPCTVLAGSYNSWRVSDIEMFYEII